VGRPLRDQRRERQRRGLHARRCEVPDTLSGGRVIEQVFHGRHTIDARQHQCGQKTRDPGLQVCPGFKGRLIGICRAESEESLLQFTHAARHNQSFEQQVIQAKRRIESRIAEPGAFGVEQDRPRRANQYVLGADIAMHQSASRACRSIPQCQERRTNQRATIRCRSQVRIESQRRKILVVLELHSQRRIVCGRRMHGPDDAADFTGGSTRHLARQQLGLPNGIPHGIQPRHRESARLLVGGEHFRHVGRDDTGGHAQPFDLMIAAPDISGPAGSDFQLR